MYVRASACGVDMWVQVPRLSTSEGFTSFSLYGSLTGTLSYQLRAPLQRGWHDLRKPHIFRASWEEWPSFLSLFFPLETGSLPSRGGLKQTCQVLRRVLSLSLRDGDYHTQLCWICTYCRLSHLPTILRAQVCATAVCERNEPGTVAWLQGKQADLINTPMCRNLPLLLAMLLPVGMTGFICSERHLSGSSCYIFVPFMKKLVTEVVSLCYFFKKKM